MTTDKQARALSRFLSLASAGRVRGSSGGARAAKALADAIVEHAPTLDGEVLEGLKTFIDLAKMQPETAREAY